VRPGYMLARNRVIGNLKARLDYFEKRVAAQRPSPRPLPRGRGAKIPPLPRGRGLRCGGISGSNISTGCGNGRRAETDAGVLSRPLQAREYSALANSIFKKHGFLPDILALKARETNTSDAADGTGNSAGIVPGAYRWFEKRFPDVCMLFQVGRFFELHGTQATRFAGVLGLKTAPAQRGLGAQSGFPWGCCSIQKHLFAQRD